jgi:hypothetical protein
VRGSLSEVGRQHEKVHDYYRLGFCLVAADISLQDELAGTSSLKKVIFTKARIIAVGFDGTILTGSSRAAMSARKSGTDSALLGVLYEKRNV